MVGGVGKSFEPSASPWIPATEGVKCAGWGDSSGQYLGAQRGSSRAKRGSRNYRGDLEQVTLSDQPTLRWSVRNVETTRTVMGRGGAGWRGWELLTVPTWARHSDTWKLLTGRTQVLKGAAGLSGSASPLSSASSAANRLLPLKGHGTTHKIDTWNIELSTRCLCANACVLAWVCVIIWMRELLIQCPIHVHRDCVLILSCPWFCDGVIGITHLDPNSPLIFRNITPPHTSANANVLEKHSW